MGTTTKLNIGKIPISKGEYQEGTTYQRLNQVTMLGSTYQSKIDNNTSAPAQQLEDGTVENINTDKWLCIAVGNISAAKRVVYDNETSGLEAKNVQGAIDEVTSKVSDLLSQIFPLLSQISPLIGNIGNYSSAFIDEQGNVGFAISKDGKILGNFDIDAIKKIIIGNNTFEANGESIELPKNLFTYNTAKLMLPSKIPYVVGQQMYVYYESILFNGFVKDFTIFSRVENEAQQKDCHIYHTNVEEDNINFKLGNSFGNLIVSKSVSVKVLDKSKEGSLKICVIGDSKSDNATKQAEVLNLCQKDGKLSVTFVGTLNKTGYDSDDNERTFSNCAISGSGIPDWCCAENIATIENPFYDDSVESGLTVTMNTNTGKYNNSPIKFSIEKAISKIGDFDILWIDHGANQQSNEETFKCYDYIINDVKRYNNTNGKNIKVVISVQEGFGLIPQYDSTIRNLRAKDALYRAANYIDRYDNRESEGVFICPQYLNVDLWNDFPCTMVYQNARNKDVTKKVCLDPIHPGVNTGTYSASKQYHAGDILAVGTGLNRDRNMYLSLTDNLGVEPNDDKVHWTKATNSLNSGYYKIADMYYATIRYILSLT